MQNDFNDLKNFDSTSITFLTNSIPKNLFRGQNFHNNYTYVHLFIPFFIPFLIQISTIKTKCYIKTLFKNPFKSTKKCNNLHENIMKECSNKKIIFNAFHLCEHVLKSFYGSVPLVIFSNASL